MGMALMSGIANSAIATVETFISEENKRKEQEYQADIYNANAKAYAAQAAFARDQGERAQEEIDDERTKLRREYTALQGQNASLLASGNVLLDSGSALDTMTGNADLFAYDMGKNRYNRVLAGWEAENQARSYDFQANVNKSKGSWLDKTAGSVGWSLLSAHHAGGKAFLGSMSSMGGGFGSMGG